MARRTGRGPRPRPHSPNVAWASTAAGSIDEDIVLSGVQALTYALALAELITEHSAETGPSEHLDRSWTQTPVEAVYHHPAALRASFPTTTPAARRRLRDPDPHETRLRAGSGRSPCTSTASTRRRRAMCSTGSANAPTSCIRTVAARCAPARTHGAGSGSDHAARQFTRDTVVVDESVWREIDLGLEQCAISTRCSTATASAAVAESSSSARPAQEKSALSAVVANEGCRRLHRHLRRGTRGNESPHCRHRGSAAVRWRACSIVLEDVDLWCRDRSAGGGAGLSQTVAGDGHSGRCQDPHARFDQRLSTLDKAAIGRDASTRSLSPGIPIARPPAR